MPEITKSAEQIERERLTRRQALRKLGFGAGLSAFMLLGVDDLARMVGAKMQQMAGDNQVANQVAEEFKSAGVAFASGGPSGYIYESFTCSAQPACKDPDQCNPNSRSWLKCIKCGWYGHCVTEQFNCTGSGSTRQDCCDKAERSCLAAGDDKCHILWQACMRS